MANTVAEPLQAPQDAGVTEPMVETIEDAVETVVVAVELHPEEFVAVKVYVPGHKPVGFIAVPVYPEGPVQ